MSRRHLRALLVLGDLVALALLSSSPDVDTGRQRLPLGHRRTLPAQVG